jgi:hypothetical protein
MRTMSSPPSTIDGASVICWATTAGIVKTDACTFRRDGAEQSRFAGLAIARYESGADCYLFLCDDAWQTANDSLHRDVEDAKAFAESLYPGISARWQLAVG